MKTLKEKIFEKIEHEKIRQKSKLYFKVKNIFAWFLTIISLIASSIFTSGIVFIISNHILIPLHILIMLIFVDALLFVVLMYLAYRHFHMIKNSYRANLRYVFIISFFAIFIFSFIFVQFRLYGKLDFVIHNRIPQLSLQNNIQENWSHPKETGMLAGEVINIDESGIVYVEDFKKQKHTVDPVLLDDSENEIFIQYLRIRMFGFEENEIFYPEQVEAWEFRQGPKFFHPDYKRPFKKGNLFFPLPEK